MTMPLPQLPPPVAPAPAVQAQCAALLRQLAGVRFPEATAESDPREEYEREFGILVDPSRWEVSVEPREAA